MPRARWIPDSFATSAFGWSEATAMKPGRKRAWLAWSSGKDSAWALHVARRSGDFDIVSLLTTVTEPHRRVSMHAVRQDVLELQARAANLPLHRVVIPSPCPDEAYATAMRRAMESAKADGVTHVIFGDVFLEDVRNYRIVRLAEVGMTAHFPLWGQDTRELAGDMIAGGLRAFVTCVDPQRLAPSFAGAEYDMELLRNLPEDVDPCAENGEFHTCVVAGPMFEAPLPVRVGETVERDGFVFADVVPFG